MSEVGTSTFLSETLALGPEGAYQLPVSSVCNARCIFCSNEMNPFPIHRLGFRPLDDVKQGIALLDPQGEQIRLGDSLPGRISEGEALLHPDLLAILRLVRERAPQSTIQISTNGSLLTAQLVEQLVPFLPMTFTISYHSHNAHNWQRIFSRSERQYTIARDSFGLLSARGFGIEGALVPLPALVGYDDIEQTIRAFKQWTDTVLIWGPGYTRLATPELRAILDTDDRELSRFMARMRKTYQMDLELKPDPLGPLAFAPFRVMRKTVYAKRRHVLWMLSEAAYTRARRTLAGWKGYFPNDHVAVKVKNHTYGGNIVCSGLLMVSDFRTAIREALAKHGTVDLIILPRNAFDYHGNDLTGEGYARLQEEFGVPVWRETC